MQNDDDVDHQPQPDEVVTEFRPSKATLGLGVVFLVGAAMLTVMWWVASYSPVALSKTYKHYIYVDKTATNITFGFLAMIFLCLGLGIGFVLLGLWQRRREAAGKPW